MSLLNDLLQTAMSLPRSLSSPRRASARERIRRAARREVIEALESRQLPAATAINAFHRSGQTFVTWTEDGAVTGEQYHVYRSQSPITTANLGAAEKLTDKWGPLDDQTSINKRSATAAGVPSRLVINDLATPLADNKGLFVYTTPEGQTGSYFYAITQVTNGVESLSLTSGSNSLASGVAEVVAEPQPVLTIRNASGKGMIFTQYMDYANWNPTFQGYAYNYSVALPDAYSSSVAWPIKLMPHAYGERMRMEQSAEYGWPCIEVFLDDPGGGAPGQTFHTWWYGFSADHNYQTNGSVPTTGVIENFTEQRILKTIDEVSSMFSVDTTRIHSQGHSMGASGSVSLGMRYANVFAGIFASEPMTNYAASPGFQTDFTTLWGTQSSNLPIVNKGKYASPIQKYDGMGVYNWMNHQEQLVNRRGDPMAFLMVGHGKADDIIDWETQGRPFIAALNAGSAAFTAESRFGWDHNWMSFNFALDAMFSPNDGGLSDWIYPNNLSFPAFRNANSSGPEDPGSSGTQFYNMQIQWSTPWNNFDQDIVDTSTRYEISLRSLVSGDVADVTPQRLQNFSTPPGTTVTWQSFNNSTGALIQSGTTTGDADGLVTLPQISLRTGGGVRLVLVASATAPTLTSPSATTTDLTPQITWNPSAGASSYDLWITNVSTGQNPVLQTNVNGTSFSPSTSLGIGLYRVWVRAKFPNGTATAWSSSRDFQITTAPVLAPIASPDYSGTPLIVWSNLPGANRYDIWVDNLTTGQSAVIRSTNVFTNWYQVSSHLGLGKFRVWVRGIDVSGRAGGWSVSSDFTSAERVNLIGPATPTFAVRPVFQWSAVSGATSYEIFVQNRTTGATVLSVRNIATSAWTSTVNLPANDYRWWVRASSTNGIAGGWSSSLDFSVGGKPIVLNSPGTTGDRAPTFTWTSVIGAASYQLWVGRLDNGAVVLNLSNLANTSYTPGSNLLPATYRIWVRAVSSTGTVSAWSSFVDITVTSTVPFGPSLDQPVVPEISELLVASRSLLPATVSEPVVSERVSRGPTEPWQDRPVAEPADSEIVMAELPVIPKLQPLDLVMAEWPLLTEL